MGLIAAIFIGGGLGATARYGLSVAAGRLLPDAVIPWGTLAANLIGCALLGFLATLFVAVDWSRPLKVGLTTGVLGGLTTFSTFSLETFVLFEAGRTGAAALDLGLDLALGLAAAALGAWVGTRMGVGLTR